MKLFLSLLRHRMIWLYCIIYWKQFFLTERSKLLSSPNSSKQKKNHDNNNNNNMMRKLTIHVQFQHVSYNWQKGIPEEKRLQMNKQKLTDQLSFAQSGYGHSYVHSGPVYLKQCSHKPSSRPSYLQLQNTDSEPHGQVTITSSISRRINWMTVMIKILHTTIHKNVHTLTFSNIIKILHTTIHNDQF